MRQAAPPRPRDHTLDYTTATFGIDPDVVKRMKLPDQQIARVDPLLVLPERPKSTKKPSASTSAAVTAAP